MEAFFDSISSAQSSRPRRVKKYPGSVCRQPAIRPALYLWRDRQTVAGILFRWPGIRFNLAHSHDLALYAVTQGREVGIDLELVQPRLADEKSVEGVFSNDEISRLKKLPAEFRVKAFFNGWTRKESYIKATGKGFSVPTDSFDVSVAPDEPAIFLCGVDPGRSLKDIDPGQEYAAAVTAEGNGWCIRQWDWS